MFEILPDNFSTCYEIKIRSEIYEQHNNADAFAPFYSVSSKETNPKF
jgi:hypothetical protein